MMQTQQQVLRQTLARKRQLAHQMQLLARREKEDQLEVKRPNIRYCLQTLVHNLKELSTRVGQMEQGLSGGESSGRTGGVGSKLDTLLQQNLQMQTLMMQQMMDRIQNPPQPIPQPMWGQPPGWGGPQYDIADERTIDIDDISISSESARSMGGISVKNPRYATQPPQIARLPPLPVAMAAERHRILVAAKEAELARIREAQMQAAAAQQGQAPRGHGSAPKAPTPQKETLAAVFQGFEGLKEGDKEKIKAEARLAAKKLRKWDGKLKPINKFRATANAVHAALWLRGRVAAQKKDAAEEHDEREQAIELQREEMDLVLGDALRLLAANIKSVRTIRVPLKRLMTQSDVDFFVQEAKGWFWSKKKVQERVKRLSSAVESILDEAMEFLGKHMDSRLSDAMNRLVCSGTRLSDTYLWDEERGEIKFNRLGVTKGMDAHPERQRLLLIHFIVSRGLVSQVLGRACEDVKDAPPVIARNLKTMATVIYRIARGAVVAEGEPPQDVSDKMVSLIYTDEEMEYLYEQLEGDFVQKEEKKLREWATSLIERLHYDRKKRSGSKSDDEDDEELTQKGKKKTTFATIAKVAAVAVSRKSKKKKKTTTDDEEEEEEEKEEKTRRRSDTKREKTGRKAETKREKTGRKDEVNEEEEEKVEEEEQVKEEGSDAGSDGKSKSERPHRTASRRTARVSARSSNPPTHKKTPQSEKPVDEKNDEEEQKEEDKGEEEEDEEEDAEVAKVSKSTRISHVASRKSLISHRTARVDAHTGRTEKSTKKSPVHAEKDVEEEVASPEGGEGVPSHRSSHHTSHRSSKRSDKDPTSVRSSRSGAGSQRMTKRATKRGVDALTPHKEEEEEEG